MGMSISALLMRWPEATPLFLRLCMACVGCSFSAFDTLEDALHVYAIPRETFMYEFEQIIARKAEKSEE